MYERRGCFLAGVPLIYVFVVLNDTSFMLLSLAYIGCAMALFQKYEYDVFSKSSGKHVDQRFTGICSGNKIQHELSAFSLNLCKR